MKKPENTSLFAEGKKKQTNKQTKEQNPPGNE